MTIGVAAWIWNWSYSLGSAGDRSTIDITVPTSVVCVPVTRALIPAVSGAAETSQRLRSGLMCGDPQGLHKAGASAASGTVLDHSQAILSPLFRANSIE